jgi:hypothetical protein
MRLAVSDHHWSCSGRLLLRRASSSDSKRTTATTQAISVTPLVLPSQPAAPGARSCTHMLRAASRACGLDVLALPNPLLQSDHTGAAWIREYDWCIDRDRDGLACER